MQVIESMRVHSAAGSNGGTISGATSATPSVITTTTAHNLQDGDVIQITGIVGTTTDNTVGYAKVTGYSPTTFGFYQDARLTTGVIGTGTYSSGGVVTVAADISGYSGDWTARLKVELLTAAKKVSLEIQNSTDGFVNDIKTVAIFDISGPVVNAAPIEKTFRAYEIPASYFGTTNGRVRLYVQSIDTGGAVVTSLFIQ